MREGAILKMKKETILEFFRNEYEFRFFDRVFRFVYALLLTVFIESQSVGMNPFKSHRLVTCPL